ncbi:hypothetical protein Daudx_2211 [Candidatus Desulforudis audaxviator]|nr:hypothetical protein Daudx_2211 [Candidatus Desulforudis audaxviator]
MLSGLKQTPGGPAGPPGNTFRSWLALIVAVWCMAGFAFLGLPALERLPGLGPAVKVVRDSGIEAGAFFYTDVDKVREAELHVRHSREYAREDGHNRPAVHQ